MAITRLDFAGLANNDPWPSEHWEGADFTAGGSIDISSSETGALRTGAQADYGARARIRTVRDDWPQEFDVVWTVEPNGTAYYYWGVQVNASDQWDPFWARALTGYRLEREMESGSWWLIKDDDGDENYLDEGTLTPSDVECVRLQGTLDGSGDMTIRVRVWDADDPEPEEWLAEEVDTDPLPAGHMTIGVSGGDQGVQRRIDLHSVEVVEDAPSPVEELTASVPLTLGGTGTLDVPAETVPTVAATASLLLGGEAALDVPAETVETIQAVAALVLGGTGMLDVPAETVSEVGATVALMLGGAGVLDVPEETVPTLTASVPLTLDGAGALDVPAESLPTLAASVPLVVGGTGVLDVPAETVETLQASVPLVLGGDGALSVPTLGVPALAASVPLVLGGSGTLDVPAETVPQLSAVVVLVLAGSGVLVDPSIPPYVYDIEVPGRWMPDVEVVGAWAPDVAVDAAWIAELEATR